MMREILLVDDERVVLKSVGAVLSEAGYAVRTTQSGERALALVREKRPDLVLLDVTMPGFDGLRVCRELRGTYASLPIVFLTALETDADELKGLASGADAYIPKTASDDILLARIAAVLRPRDESQFAVAGDFSFGNWLIESGRMRMRTRGGLKVPLSDREIAILRLFASHPDEVFSFDSILDMFWGAGTEWTTSTVQVAMSRLRKKLGRSGSLLATVYGLGYSYHQTQDDL